MCARCISMHFIIGVWCGTARHGILWWLSYSFPAHSFINIGLSFLPLLFVSALRSLARSLARSRFHECAREHIAIVFIAHRDVYRIMYCVSYIWVDRFLWLVGHCEWVRWLILRRWKMEITVWFSYTDNLIDTLLFMRVWVELIAYKNIISPKTSHFFSFTSVHSTFECTL